MAIDKGGPENGATANRAAVARWRQARRDAGEIPKERWAHRDDWPAIDAYIRAKAAARNVVGCGEERTAPGVHQRPR